jgi:hypothetical protein
MMDMKNPWEDVVRDGNGNYYAKIDKDAVFELKNRLEGTDCALHLECYVDSCCTGDPNAPVYLLTLNPRYDPNTDKIADEALYERYSKKHRGKKPEYPYGPLDPELKDTGAAAYVRGRMHWIWEELAKKAGIDEEAAKKIVANTICEVLYFSYKSKQFSMTDRTVPSQEYTFELVREAIKRGALIIIMRSQKLWEKKVPELKKHKEKGLVYVLKSPRHITISPGNISPEGFDKLIETIMAAA